jgi:hypothetical protein
MKNLCLRISGLVALVAGAAFAQVAAEPQVRAAVGRVSGAATFPAQAFIPPAVVGAPYSADQIQEHVQTLNDGTHITETQMHMKLYRDSQGRTRTERPLMMGLPNGQDSPTVVEITDPAEGVRYTLDVQNKIAHRVKAQPPSGAQGRSGILAGAIGPASPPLAALAPQTRIVNGPALPATVRARIEGNEEKLPPQTIEGVLAEGVRHTLVIPEGAEGNDRPFSIISETWTAPDLKIGILMKSNDPRYGESITKLTNISRNEPDPTLFQPPPDYQVVDETGTFSINYSR